MEGSRQEARTRSTQNHRLDDIVADLRLDQIENWKLCTENIPDCWAGIGFESGNGIPSASYFTISIARNARRTELSVQAGIEHHFLFLCSTGNFDPAQELLPGLVSIFVNLIEAFVRNFCIVVRFGTFSTNAGQGNPDLQWFVILFKTDQRDVNVAAEFSLTSCTLAAARDVGLVGIALDDVNAGNPYGTRTRIAS